MSTPVLALPAEVRIEIYDLVIDTSDIIMPGPLPDGVTTLLLASKQTRSELLYHLWNKRHITWQGRVTCKKWQKFQRVAVPYIRNLTIVVNPDRRNSGSGLDGEYHRLLKWMCRRSRHDLRARYLWNLQGLTLRDLPRGVNPHAVMWDSWALRWTRVHHRPLDYQNWTPTDWEQHLLDELRGCGVEVAVQLLDPAARH